MFYKLFKKYMERYKKETDFFQPFHAHFVEVVNTLPVSVKMCCSCFVEKTKPIEILPDKFVRVDLKESGRIAIWNEDIGTVQLNFETEGSVFCNTFYNMYVKIETCHGSEMMKEEPYYFVHLGDLREKTRYKNPELAEVNNGPIVSL